MVEVGFGLVEVLVVVFEVVFVVVLVPVLVFVLVLVLVVFVLVLVFVLVVVVVVLVEGTWLTFVAGFGMVPLLLLLTMKPICRKEKDILSMLNLLKVNPSPEISRVIPKERSLFSAVVNPLYPDTNDVFL